MSTKYTGGFITKSPVAPTTSAASGIWTLDQQQQAQKAGTWPSPPVFIEDLFSTYLYTGNGSTLTIANGIDLSTKGGLVWAKSRDAAEWHSLCDTARGVSSQLSSNATNAAGASGVTQFNSNGYATSGSQSNLGSTTYVSWTFREQPKFFDVVTWTGTGSNTTIAHSLGSVPGCIIVKRTDTTAAWAVYHRSLANTQYLVLNTTAAAATGATWWNSTTPTSAVFSVGTDASVNASGGTYVAYLFAHNAGGFGLTGTDNVISCGSFTIDGSGFCPVVNIGYEPQYLLAKSSSGGSNWIIVDTMRGFSQTNMMYLAAQSSGVETDYTNAIVPTATGFGPGSVAGFAAGSTFIYIAIRRGPMKTPTVGTSVFDISTVSTASGPVPGPTPTDMTLNKPSYDVSTNSWRANDRLRGGGLALFPNTTGVESAENYVYFDYQSGLRLSSWPVASTIWYNFKRAPSFFDEVCYTGTDTGTRILDHNLTVTPELVIVKKRSAALDWAVQASTFTTDNILFLNTTAALTSTPSYLSYPEQNTSTTFKVRYNLNVISETYVAYLFATCAGVSKVGSYTGTGALQTINCAFTTGARFVLIKRTDSTGDWYTYDSARGITSGNDPYLLMNTNAAQVTGTNYVDTDTTGFQVTAAAPAALNANGGTFIFLAIA